MRSLVYQSSLKALEAAEGEDSEVEGEAVDKRLAAVAVEALVAEVADWVAAEVAVEAADWEAVEAEDSLRDVTRPAGNSADQSKLAIGGSEESLGTGDVTCNGYFDDKLLLTRPRRAPMRMRFESSRSGILVPILARCESRTKRFLMSMPLLLLLLKKVCFDRGRKRPATTVGTRWSPATE